MFLGDFYQYTKIIIIIILTFSVSNEFMGKPIPHILTVPLNNQDFAKTYFIHYL